MATNTLSRTSLPSALPVAIGLAAGFAIAQGTGVRALGGLVFAAGGVAAGLLWRRRRGWAVTTGLAAVYLVAFVLAHVLAIGVGWPAWLAVGVVTIVAAGIAFGVADRSQPA